MMRFLILASLLLSSAAFATPRSNVSHEWRSLRQNVSFSEDWSRYPAPDVILETLRTQFPYIDLAAMSTSCLAETADTRTVLGANSALTGDAVIARPNSAFVVWYTGCVKEFVRAEFSLAVFAARTDSAALTRYLGPRLSTMCRISASGSYETPCHWPNLPLADRLAGISEHIEALLGPDDVIRDSGIAANTAELALRIDTQIVSALTSDPASFAFLDISAVDGAQGFGTLQAIRAIKFLTLLNDTLKY